MILYYPRSTLDNDAQRHRNDRREIKEMQSFNAIIHHLSKDNTNKVRKWEQIKMKMINATKANSFNQNCLREHLCPKSIKLSGRRGNSWMGVRNTLLQRIDQNEIKLEHLKLFISVCSLGLMVLYYPRSVPLIMMQRSIETIVGK